MLRSFYICYFLMMVYPLAAQDSLQRKPDITRVRYHESIEKEQLLASSFNNGNGKLIHVSNDPAVNKLVTSAIIDSVINLKNSIEFCQTLNHRLKVKYLSGVENLVKGFNTGWRNGSFSPLLATELVRNYKLLLHADTTSTSIVPIIEQAAYEVSNIHINGTGSAFYENAGFTASQQELYKIFCRNNPDKVLSTLENFYNVPFADSLVSAVATINPTQVYDFASATQTQVGRLIARNRDPLVRAIVTISSTRAGQQYFPFLDEILHGRLNVHSIAAIADNPVEYYRLLVKTQVSYVDRMIKKDTPIAYDKLLLRLQDRAKNVFVEEVNALHDYGENVRFKILDPLTPDELYYLIVLSEDVIYTSSYKGVFKRMMQKMPVPSGDSLLMSVRFDRFKKFIRLAAGYNMLDEFLKYMPEDNSKLLMMAFVRGLENSGTLEDAVDVADSYGSIRDENIKALIDAEINRNLSAAKSAKDLRASTIYNILETIFQSSQNTDIDIAGLLKIPPVYHVNYSNLTDKNGKVVQQVFFYGDQDGKESFANFMGMFNNRADWKVNRNASWVEIQSAKGKPISIFANLPLDYEKGLDSVAQAALRDYLLEKEIEPTITIHRGHSYWVGSTIRHLAPSSKIVILGSCGGFHNLDDVLRTCPDAHIISSKEVGTRHVNEPILKAINDDLQKGNNIEWLPIWKNLAAKFPSGDAKERFDNYVPPHQNLGALFIKAYSRQMGE